MSSRPKKGSLVLVTVLCILSLMLSACGKKGDPTLVSYEKPDAPSSVMAINREGSIIIGWNFPRSAESSVAEFIVMKSTGAAFQKIIHVAAHTRTFVDTDISIGNTYRYKVISQNFRGIYSDDSNTIDVTPVQLPPPPGKLAYAVKDEHTIITWEAAGAGIQYNIYKADEKGSYGLTPLNSAPLTETVFKDVFSVNRIARYTVRSLTGNILRGEGAASSELVMDPADLVPPQPKDVQAYPASDGIYLSWAEYSESWVTGFRVYRRSGTDEYVLIGQTQIPTFIDKGASEQARDYRVAAVGPAKEGPAAEITNVMFIPQR